MHAANDNPPGKPADNDPGAPGAAETPQVRTLLLTDLCDSTQLVERLGDAAAAELFREHDRLVLGLQQQWRGRLIDRSDGLLLLFDRAVDGLGFALDYARGLRDIGERRKLARHGLELRARSGLHVGEVLTWRNSDAAVSFGAKPLEVEGLAKPMAGRLMTLARPGQILLSATAEPLAHRAARELGERGDQLIWKDWGRWRFKGVPQSQQVYEVGEPGISPLRAPQQNRAKAWRDIPVWRRPTALAAELLLVAGLVGGAWFLTRPQPAIAFNERDWVVVGDLRNLTGDSVLDDSLEQAFRISLEQSRYVNVLSDLKARDTLERMRRKPDTVLDRAISSEIALRDGARAVILPTVAEVGGRLRVSAEVIDPHTQTTVYAVSRDGRGTDSALSSIDGITSDLRNRLGEAVESIQRTSVPLPNVTTSNLDALKSYALGTRRQAEGKGKEALGYYQRAQQLDPQFALAHLATGVVYISQLGDFVAARREFKAASRLRDRLTDRERLQLDATLSRLGPPAPAMQRWHELLGLYPDALSAHMILGQMEAFDAGDFEAALVEAKAVTVPQYERQGPAHYLRGIALVGLERYRDAIAQFEASRAAGYQGAVYSYAAAYAAQRDWANVAKVLALRRQTGVATGEISVPEQASVFAVDQGRWAEAVQRADEAVEAAERAEPVYAATSQRTRKLVLATLLGTEPVATRAMLRREIDLVRSRIASADETDRPNFLSVLQSLGYVAAMGGDRQSLQAALQGGDAGIAAQYPMLSQMRTVLLSEADRMDGNAAAAVARLSPLAARRDSIVPVHSALLRALRAGGDATGALAQARWLQQHRGRAYVEDPTGAELMAMRVADTTLALLDEAELQQQAGNAAAAAKARDAFLRAWPERELPTPIRERWVASLPGSGAGASR
jgi:putative peptide modification system cyclase